MQLGHGLRVRLAADPDLAGVVTGQINTAFSARAGP
ncbi:hypothetical protein P608_20990 [Comamonas thiooxydans]|uniref:Uncharacterized protein n=1 Tax=Comamonas thiooxydans TaxID=363952 RepID=A0A0E3BSM9_9BURK|nr:hypothetical protein P608_20990 [Comamonas thiooxydans]